MSTRVSPSFQQRHVVAVAAAAAAGRGGAERAQRGEWPADAAGFAVSTHALGGWVAMVIYWCFNGFQWVSMVI